MEARRKFTAVAKFPGAYPVSVREEVSGLERTASGGKPLFNFSHWKNGTRVGINAETARLDDQIQRFHHHRPDQGIFLLGFNDGFKNLMLLSERCKAKIYGLRQISDRFPDFVFDFGSAGGK